MAFFAIAKTAFAENKNPPEYEAGGPVNLY